MFVFLVFIVLISGITLPAYSIGQSHISNAPVSTLHREIIPRTQLRAGIDFIIRGDYDGAREYVKNGMTADDLAKHFLSASALYTRMSELETTEEQDEFMRETEWIIGETTRRIREYPDDSAAYFYRGMILSYRSVLNKLSGNLWGAFKDARAGKKELEKCIALAPDFPEPYVVLGSYKFWMSAINFLRFLPLIPDNRKKGIDEIYAHLLPESISYEISLNQLVWILVQYMDYEQAEKIAGRGLMLYPSSRFFLYPAAIVAQRREKWKEAATLLNQVKESLERDGLFNRYMWLKVTVKQAESLVKIEKYEEALRLCAEVNDSKVVEFEFKKSKDLYKRASSIEKLYASLVQN